MTSCWKSSRLKPGASLSLITRYRKRIISMFVTPEEPLAGKDVTYDVDIPATLLHPTPDGRPASGSSAGRIRLRPLTVKDVQLIAKAAKDDEVLTSVLMIQRAVVEPPLKQHQVADMHSGLVGF